MTNREDASLIALMALTAAAVIVIGFSYNITHYVVGGACMALFAVVCRILK